MSKYENKCMILSDYFVKFVRGLHGKHTMRSEVFLALESIQKYPRGTFNRSSLTCDVVKRVSYNFIQEIVLTLAKPPCE